MALKATVFKATLQIADLDRHYYADHALTLARHPSETDDRMMVRLLAFALHANEALTFTRGLSTGDEPDLWQKDLSGAIQTWIELGQPDVKRMRAAAGRAERVFVYCYSGRSADIWWQQVRARVQATGNLSVRNLPPQAVRELATLAQRSMQLHCTIQDGQALVADDCQTVQVPVETWQA
jgi:uncharacterized protein YaeQ